ncbi:MAG TPA: acetyl-CoA carboxylase biotin carboxyl carrier protein subunit [Ktedonobacterales bacterium]
MVRERAERGGETPTAQPRNTLSVAELRQLIALMNNTDLEEITIEQEASGLRLTLRKPPVPLSAATLPAEPELFEAGETLPAEPLPAESGAEVRAPLVGIFRSALKTGGHPLASAGEMVREGQVVGAIESLNVLNEVETSAGGRVKEILVSDGQPVEYGQPLLVIDAAGA